MQICFVNRTSHDINIMVPGKETITLPKDHSPIRITVNKRWKGEWGGIEFVSSEYSERDIADTIESCLAFAGRGFNVSFNGHNQENEEVHFFVVSRMVIDAIAHSGHKDRYHALEYLVAPDTAPSSVVRDDNGRVIGVRRLYTLSSFFLPPSFRERA